MQKSKKLGILVGGGPAPGINSVIGAVTIEAVNSGYSVIGIYNGFKYLEKGKKVLEFLNIPKVSRIHLTGGSILKTSRANPTKSEDKLKTVVETLKDMEINYLITIGGDDTAFAAMKVSETAEYMGYDLRIAHVPKTIDNDLPLPAGIPTFGFETARAEGARLASILAEDARTSGRWYIVICMGRKTGHLALGIGKSAGATLTLIPEEFMGKITLKLLVDHIVSSIIKRLSIDMGYGVAVVAEGFLEFLDPKELETYLTSHETIERDEYGHIRLSELNFSDILKNAVKTRLRDFNIKMRLVDQEFGYELRCVGPCAYDIDYTRNLGYGAFDFLRRGEKNALISIQGDQIVPMTFKDIFDSVTQKTRVRYVDINSLSFKIATEYMIRLEKSDFEDSEQLSKLAQTAHISAKQFKTEFEYLVK
ncbi:MAG TPA: diphosphate--fructose-6-phosphate 1-phosphotransferase [Candidatus Eremiobacteraeota bacterium]|nr:MAG: 6-phosphofructokinase 1 [bacterium ADurb.Bin363]HPZ10604.1 diphosphate--fructose-6-phosphate 1-phosphotransferase [Candidatus Eremiobacteraeota bacterium]